MPYTLDEMQATKYVAKSLPEANSHCDYALDDTDTLLVGDDAVEIICYQQAFTICKLPNDNYWSLFFNSQKEDSDLAVVEKWLYAQLEAENFFE